MSADLVKNVYPLVLRIFTLRVRKKTRVKRTAQAAFLKRHINEI